MGESLAVIICFFIANLLGTIVYGCLLVLHREVPLRFYVDVVATGIFGVGCVVWGWQYIPYIKKMFRKQPSVVETRKDV